MYNNKIRNALREQRDGLYKHLVSQPLSGFFRQEFGELKDGTGIILDDNDGSDEMDALKERSEDTSFDTSFTEKVNEVYRFDEAKIVSDFEGYFQKLVDYITENHYEKEVQAIFITYDYDYHYNGKISGYGKADYPVIETPQYLEKDIKNAKVIFEYPEAIRFESVWADCEAFEWTEDHLQVNFDLQSLFQNHSRLILHHTLHSFEEKGGFKQLALRPFSFYIHEHDLEVMSLYRLE